MNFKRITIFWILVATYMCVPALWADTEDTPTAVSSALDVLEEEVSVPADSLKSEKAAAPAVETKVFPLNYVSAEDMKTKLLEVLTPGVGHIVADPRSNKIVITDTAQKIEELKEAIAAFDVKEKELVIEAKIVQISLNDEHKEGVDWAAIVSDYHRLSLSQDADVPARETRELSVGTVSADDYEILLEALDTVGKTEVVSNPRIMAVNNKEERVLINILPEDGSKAKNSSTGKIKDEESEINLYLKPSIHNNGEITFKINSVVESMRREITRSKDGSILVKGKPIAEAAVTVKNNVTIVIGGLIKERKIPSVRKIPLLGDLPIVGFAFRNEREQTRKSEVVVFLTPKVTNTANKEGPP